MLHGAFLLLLLLAVPTFAEEVDLTLRHLQLLKLTNIEYPLHEDLIEVIDFERPLDNATTPCNEVDRTHMVCDFMTNCTLGELTTVDCHISNPTMVCSGPTSFSMEYPCSYCWQIETPNSYDCMYLRKHCMSGYTRYRTFCTTRRDVLCMGNRTFEKVVTCKFTTGRTWIVALVMSVLLGVVGADRCFLGYWGWGVFKLFSCGGVSIWVLVDIILIYTQVLGPADGSVYWAAPSG